MAYLDTRDLETRRDELKQDILDDWNEKFEDNQLDDYEDIPLNSEVEEEEDFINYWKSEREEIEKINQVEDEVGSEFSYGCTLIDEDDFEDSCRELCEEVGYISKDFPSWIEIDWEATSDNMRDDYSELEYQGTTYLFRA